MVSPPRRERYLRDPLRRSSRKSCTAQAFEITVILRLHPQSGHYAEDPGVGQNRACCFRIPSHVCSLHRGGGRASRQQAMLQVLPILRYGHMLLTADLPARDIAALLPIVTQRNSTRDG